MRIDEFEFRDTKGNEIEPTKNQLVIYIKSLQKQIKDLKYENKVMKRALELAVVDMTHTNDGYIRHIKEQHYLLNAEEEIKDETIN